MIYIAWTCVILACNARLREQALQSTALNNGTDCRASQSLYETADCCGTLIPVW